MSSSNCCFLTCIQVSQEASQVVWYSHLFKNFPQFIVIHTVEGFGIVNKSEVDVFLELPHLSMIQWMMSGNSQGPPRTLEELQQIQAGAGVVAVWCWSNFEETPHVQGQRRSPSKMEGVARLHLESNPIPTRDAQSAQRNLVHTRTQRPHRD